MKTLILSDLHLGTDTSCSKKYLDGLRGLARQFDRVILNGDTFDRFDPDQRCEGTRQLLRDVRDACTSRSGPPTMLTGNHDPFISDTHWVYLPQSATLVFHGDCIADCTHPTKPEEQTLAAAMAQQWIKLGGRPDRFLDLIDVHRRVQGQFLRENPPICEPRKVLRYLLAACFPPQRPLHVLRYWYRAPGAVGRLASTFDQPVRNAVFGHTHRPGRWQTGTVTVFNTGSFMPLSRPYAVICEGTNVHAQPLLPLLQSTRLVASPLSLAQGTPPRNP